MTLAKKAIVGAFTALLLVTGCSDGGADNPPDIGAWLDGEPDFDCGQRPVDKYCFPAGMTCCPDYLPDDLYAPVCVRGIWECESGTLQPDCYDQLPSCMAGDVGPDSCVGDGGCGGDDMTVGPDSCVGGADAGC